MILANPGLVREPYEEFANGIRYNGKFYPFQSYTFNLSGQLLTPVKNGSFFVKSLIFSIRTIAADTATIAYVGSKQDNVSQNFAFASVIPSVAQVVFSFVDINQTFDRGEPIIFGHDGTIQQPGCNITYAVVDTV